MPELPEVQNIADSLRPVIVGRSIVDCTTRQPKALNLPLNEFRARVSQQVVGVSRSAKSIECMLVDGSLWLHLGVSGVLLYDAAGSTPAEADPMVGFVLDDGSRLRLERAFMGNAHYLSSAEGEVRRSRAGVDPLGPGWTIEWLQALAARRPTAGLKALLSDQAIVGGIGNSYSDEVLFAAHLLPDRKLGSVSPDELRSLHAAARDVLADSLAAGGDSSYTDVHGTPGRYETAIHHREVCTICGTAAARGGPDGKGAFYCPHCQH
jgi:formamidopyrimidine-DNA glycosylase